MVKKKLIWYVILVVISIIIVLMSYNITSYLYSYKKDLEIIQELKEMKNDVEFDKLKEINSDTVGFIKIDNTNISYPIVKSNDNKYYLTHSFTKEKSKRGSIFLDYRNNLDKLSRNNIIYGHGLVDNTMFGSLDNLLDSTLLDKEDNHYIKIITDNSIMTFKIFSVYTINKESYYIKTYFSNNEYFKEFLEIIIKRSIYNFDTSVNTDDKILTLSTCKNDFGKRIVVHSKLLKKEETN